MIVKEESKYRGKPFWAWNGKLEPEELRRQIRIMKKMGFGGFFMHSRVGLDTEYLGKEWFKCVDVCVDEARKNKMEAWLYDEDRWPSGAAGGLVTKNKNYRMRKLLVRKHQTHTTVNWTPETVAVFQLELEGKTAANIVKISDKSKLRELKSGEMILTFSVKVNEDNAAFNGHAYLDTMNPDAVKAFIKITHESYLKRYGKDFGKLVPGIFTDEPNHGAMIDGGYYDRYDRKNEMLLPWTGILPKVFKKRFGYDLVEHLVELIFDIKGEQVSQARYHYHDCTAHLFTESFYKQIGDWCEKHNLTFTGHSLCEDTLTSQTSQLGSAMRGYEYMHAPGMDLLTERDRVYNTAKQVSSAARQFGRKWRLTELYGCTGWDFSFAGHKALGDWQAALGINLRSHHLSWYTMAGQAKRDYPASILDQSPWWELYPKVEDYFARLHAAMDSGTEVRDLLVIHPVESMWINCKAGWKDDPVVKKQNENFISLCDSLLCSHIDFDYGDEEILSRHGKIVKRNGKTCFAVSKAVYSTVLVPELETIRSTTLSLLESFDRAGGTVVFKGKPPRFVDAHPSDSAAKLHDLCKSKAASIESARRINITDGKGKEAGSVLYLLKENRDNYYLFIVNTSLSKKQRDPSSNMVDRVVDRKVSYPEIKISGLNIGISFCYELDLESGNMFQAVVEKGLIKTDLPVLGSRLFVVSKTRKKQKCQKRITFSETKNVKLAKQNWQVQLSENNCLVLDRPKYKIGGNEYQEPEEILRIDKIIRKYLGIEARGSDMVQPWAKEKVKNPKKIRVELSYEFFTENLPTGDLFLATETPEVFYASLNGISVNMHKDSGWWVDPSLRQLKIDNKLLAVGKNNLTLRLEYDENYQGLEIVYLLGQFGVKLQGSKATLVKPVKSLKIGDWCTQGLTFYSGSVIYETAIGKPDKCENVFVRIPDYRGTAVRIFVNGKVAGVAAWEPNEVNITHLLTKKSNRVGIEVLSHRRNSHGPFHYTEKWPIWTGPAEYQSEGTLWQDSYNLVPCGLVSDPELCFYKPL
ncbi:MAG: hypothetical protein JNL74_03480 [Fibrobacteres bacterium]|nr:hypothetical protein [Fibrobacterota bacterium]